MKPPNNKKNHQNPPQQKLVSYSFHWKYTKMICWNRWQQEQEILCELRLQIKVWRKVVSFGKYVTGKVVKIHGLYR